MVDSSARSASQPHTTGTYLLNKDGVPIKPRPQGSNPDAFMSPKWADVDRNLTQQPQAEKAATAPATTDTAPEHRTFGAPNIQGRPAMRRSIGLVQQANAAPRPQGGNPDAFMSPKWADVDRKLNQQQAAAGPSSPQASTESLKPRTLGAPNIRGLATSPSEGRAYSAGYALGNRVASARNAIVSAPQNARDAVARKQEQVRAGVTNAKNLVLNAPSNIKKGALAKQSAAQHATGAKSRRGGFSMAGGQKAPANWNEVKDGARKMAVRGGPVLFWLVAGIAVIKDIIDMFSALLDGFGLLLEGTVIGAPVGLGLQVFSEIIDKLAGLFIDVTLLAYFGYIGGGFALRLVIMSVGAIIDALPLVDVLPLTTISFFAAYLVGRAAKKATQIIDSSLGRAIGKAGAAVGGAARMGGRFVKAISR